MSDNLVSIDEFLSARKDFVRGGDILMKAAVKPPSWDAAKRSARFVMSTEEPDRDGDIVIQAGLDTDSFEKNPVSFFAHASYGLPLGSWEDIAKINGKPKRTEGTHVFIKQGLDPRADLVATHVQEGTLRACSIGFKPKTVRRREQAANSFGYPGYEVLEGELFECSIVSLPANASAMVKSLSQETRLGRDLLEEILDTWAKHPESGLLIPKADIEKAWREYLAKGATAVVSKDEPEVRETTHSVTVKVEMPTAPLSASIAKHHNILQRMTAALAGVVRREKAAPAPLVVDRAAIEKRIEASRQRVKALGIDIQESQQG